MTIDIMKLVEAYRCAGGSQEHTARKDHLVYALTELIEERDRLREYANAVKTCKNPILYQYRMRPVWVTPDAWTGWEDCSKEAAENYTKLKIYQDWEYQSRKLYED